MFITLRASCGAVLFGPVYGGRAGGVGLLPRFIACIDPHPAGFVGKGSDHLQLIKFWPSRAPGKVVCGGAIFLVPPYYSQRTVFASL